MGFKAARQATIDALLDGRFEHEERSVADGKNLLASGEVSVDEVVSLLRRCKGDQYEARPHHFDAGQPIDIFRPIEGGRRWYIKSYLIRLEEVVAVFISVHWR